jgi:hypothetical protein
VTSPPPRNTVVVERRVHEILGVLFSDPMSSEGEASSPDDPASPTTDDTEDATTPDDSD